MLEDLTMIATLPVDEAAVKKAKDEAALIDDDIDKAAAGETMPPPKEKSEDPADDTTAGRIARRGQDPPEHDVNAVKVSKARGLGGSLMTGFSDGARIGGSVWGGSMLGSRSTSPRCGSSGGTIGCSGVFGSPGMGPCGFTGSWAYGVNIDVSC